MKEDKSPAPLKENPLANVEAGDQSFPTEGFEPKNLRELMDTSQFLSLSSMVPKEYHKNPQDIVAAAMLGFNLGLSLMQSLRSVAVINGRPCLWGDAVVAIVVTKPDYEYHKESWDDVKKVATCIAKRKGQPERTVTFSMADAKVAGLDGKDNYKKYPARMCQMRARSWAFRDTWPHHLSGISFAEEAMDIPQEKEISATVVESERPQTRGDQVEAALGIPKEKAYDVVEDYKKRISESTSVEDLEGIGSEIKNSAVLTDEQQSEIRPFYKNRKAELSG
jgi:hypothetical protein